MWFQEADKIYLVPIGKIQWWILEDVKTTLEERFLFSVTIVDSVPFPYEAVTREREQMDTREIFRILSDWSPKGLVIGVIDFDIFTQGVNFLFGEADPVEGIAVVSMARLREEFYGSEPAQELMIERLKKEVVHEMGHLFSLRHCPHDRCVMHFSNTISTTDFKTDRFCPVCSKTLKEVTDGGYQAL
ncbi:MAG: hypothetical protein D6726_12180 [Nitrospirae bacterium]|nr:MAG: hypothetical protein D6726_12180 [Nitrospirota bacterium]